MSEEQLSRAARFWFAAVILPSIALLIVGATVGIWVSIISRAMS